MLFTITSLSLSSWRPITRPTTMKPQCWLETVLDVTDQIKSFFFWLRMYLYCVLLKQNDFILQMAPKQKIRIKLRSYWVRLIEDSCKQIMDAARTTNAKTMGPVPLPTKKRIYCVLKSPHVHKDARFHFEIRTHQRLIDILYPTAQTIDSLMQLDIPAGVDVEVKLWKNKTSSSQVNFWTPRLIATWIK